jgi:hypothetical protein
MCIVQDILDEVHLVNTTPTNPTQPPTIENQQIFIQILNFFKTNRVFCKVRKHSTKNLSYFLSASTAATYIFTAPTCTTTIITLEPCALKCRVSSMSYPGLIKFSYFVNLTPQRGDIGGERRPKERVKKG